MRRKQKYSAQERRRDREREKRTLIGEPEKKQLMERGENTVEGI